MYAAGYFVCWLGCSLAYPFGCLGFVFSALLVVVFGVFGVATVLTLVDELLFYMYFLVPLIFKRDYIAGDLGVDLFQGAHPCCV